MEESFQFYQQLIQSIHLDYKKEIDSLRDRVRRSEIHIRNLQHEINDVPPHNRRLNIRYYESMIESEQRNIDINIVQIVRLKDEKEKLAAILHSE